MTSNLSNEEIVKRIQRGISKQYYLEMLYDNNFRFLKMTANKFKSVAEIDDLMQVGYMALQESAERFDESQGVKFSTFAFRWVRFRMAAYAESCGFLIKIPQDLKPLLGKYRAIERSLQFRNEDFLSDIQVGWLLGVSTEKAKSVRILAGLKVKSLDEPISQEEDNFCLSDVVEDPAAAFEDSLIDEMQCEELWKTVRDNTNDEQFFILKEHYGNEKAVGQIADEMGTQENEIRKKKNSALRRLRSVNKMKCFADGIEEVDAKIYNSGFRNYKEHDFTSNTEFVAIRRSELEAGYGRCLDEFLNARDGPRVFV